jgi:hypothetical protein
VTAAVEIPLLADPEPAEDSPRSADPVSTTQAIGRAAGRGLRWSLLRAAATRLGGLPIKKAR